MSDLFPNCPECTGPLAAEAIGCRCGWKRPVDKGGFVKTRCRFFDVCVSTAIARAHTAEGWIDVCLKCYSGVEKVPVSTGFSHAAEETRAAYEKSANFRRKQEGEVVPGSIGDHLSKAKRRV